MFEKSQAQEKRPVEPQGNAEVNRRPQPAKEEKTDEPVENEQIKDDEDLADRFEATDN